MSIVKNAIDCLMRHILRVYLPKNRRWQIADGLDSNHPATVTLRTFPLGGDPFDDRIEFHLANRPGVPRGFRMPPAERAGSAELD